MFTISYLRCFAKMRDWLKSVIILPEDSHPAVNRVDAVNYENHKESIVPKSRDPPMV